MQELLRQQKEPPMGTVLEERELQMVVAMVRRLLGDRAPASAVTSRRRLQSLLTCRAPGEIPEVAWPLLDAIWSVEAARRPVVNGAALPRLGAAGWSSRVSLWRGDITTLRADAVVNAANSGLTGCYRPFHACVDNAIHTAAGPRLREECGQLVAERGHAEPGTATTTSGWFLPARYVLHTVGPIVASGQPSSADAQRLRRCYRECLRAASELRDVRSVAFCAISTGVFGYPAAAAAPLALAAVRGWLEESDAVEQVIFVTYSAADEAVYAAAVREETHVS